MLTKRNLRVKIFLDGFRYISCGKTGENISTFSKCIFPMCQGLRVLDLAAF